MKEQAIVSDDKSNTRRFFWALVVISISALCVVYCKHVNRQLFMELQRQESIREREVVRWGQLLLEQSTLTAHGRIEQIAHERLQMELPAQSNVVIVKNEP